MRSLLRNSFSVLWRGSVLAAFASLAVSSLPASSEVERWREGNVDCAIWRVFDDAPPAGYMPFQLRIVNRSEAGFNQPFRSHASAPYQEVTAFSASQSIGVPQQSERQISMLVPLPNLASLGYSGQSVNLSLGWLGSSNVSTGSSGRGRFIVIGKDSLGRFESQIEADLRSASVEAILSSASIELLPEDWRAYFGVDEVWLTGDEWNRLRPAQQLALQDWVTRWGRLVLWDSAADASFRQQWEKRGASWAGPLAATASVDASRLQLGFGDIVQAEWKKSGPNPEVKAAVGYLREMAATGRELISDLGGDYRDWQAYRDLPKLRVNVPLTLFFILVFAILVGPVNLFVFATGKHRYRLFWTTPLLSIGATLVLWVLILIVDGFGATGNRCSLVWVSPAMNRAYLSQEQVVKTGVLVNRSFRFDGPVAVQLLKLSAVNNLHGGGRPQTLALNEVNGVYDGDWFSSRSMCGLYLEAVEPFRGRIEVTNLDEFKTKGAAPEIISSLPSPLSILEVVDAQGNIWRGRNIATGQRVTLEKPVDSGELVRPQAQERLGSANRLRLNRLSGRRNCFFAIATGKEPLMETLPGIRWDRQDVVFAGSLE